MVQILNLWSEAKSPFFDSSELFTDHGGNLDAARIAEFEDIHAAMEARSLRARLRRNWHATVMADDPPCGPLQWRCKDRSRVVDIAAMDDGHLLNAMAFAKAKRHHASKLPAVVAEAKRRNILP